MEKTAFERKKRGYGKRRQIELDKTKKKSLSANTSQQGEKTLERNESEEHLIYQIQQLQLKYSWRRSVRQEVFERYRQEYGMRKHLKTKQTKLNGCIDKA